MSYTGELNADQEIMDGNRMVIYGAGGYGEKIYRNLAIYDKQKNVKAFIDDIKVGGYYTAFQL